jgi:hypothetical protein
VAVGLAYFTFRATIKIPHFQRVFADMLDGGALPILTVWSFGESESFVCRAFYFLWQHWPPCSAESAADLFTLWVIALMILLQFAIICQALSEPLPRLVDQLGATPK